MPQDFKKHYQDSNILELGYLAYRQSFFRHGRHIKVLNQANISNETESKSTLNPSIIRLSDFPVNPIEAKDYFKKITKHSSGQEFYMALSAKEITTYCLENELDLRQLFLDYKSMGLDYIGGQDLMTAIVESGNSLSMWLEVHQLIHEVGLKSEAILYPHKDLGFDELSRVIGLLDLLQESHQGFLYIDFPDQGTINDQLRLIASTRILSKHIHDLKINMNPGNLLSSQVKLGFGANVASRIYSESGDILGSKEFLTIVKKCQGTPVDFQASTLNEQMAQAFNSMKLYRLNNSSRHDLSQLTEVVSHSPLPAIGTGVVVSPGELTHQKIQTCKLADIQKVEASPIYEAIDFSQGFGNSAESDISMDHIKTFVETCGTHKNFKVIGFRGIWEFCRNKDISLSSFAEFLKNIGVTLVMSSEIEPEDALTNSEILELHSTFHKQGIKTIGKVELSAPYNGTGIPFWEPFIQRLLSMISLNKDETQLQGLIIQESNNSFVSLKEYLKAVSISHIVCKELTNIITPINRIGSGVMQPKIETDREFTHISNLLSSFGATSLGLEA